ncbi:MAG: hypothetical protein Fur0041_15230 [Bacteroidia bacterium]
MKNNVHRKGHTYNVDGLGTIGIIFGIVSVGFIIYNVLNVIFS